MSWEPSSCQCCASQLCCLTFCSRGLAADAAWQFAAGSCVSMSPPSPPGTHLSLRSPTGCTPSDPSPASLLPLCWAACCSLQDKASLWWRTELPATVAAVVTPSMSSKSMFLRSSLPNMQWPPSCRQEECPLCHCWAEVGRQRSLFTLDGFSLRAGRAPRILSRGTR